jgi:hypothetical protein
VKNVSLAARSSPIRLPAAFAVGVMPNANLLAQCDPRRSRFLRDGAGRYGTLRESAESGERRAVTRRSASLLANSRSTSIRLAGVQIPSGTLSSPIRVATTIHRLPVVHGRIRRVLAITPIRADAVRRIWRSALPQAVDAVAVEGLLVGCEWDVFNLRLSDEHPVEGITVMAGKSRLHVGVLDRDRQDR